jgi:hypothetical protein
MRAVLSIILLTAASPLFAHWETANPNFPWATPGQTRWLIDYATVERAHVEMMLDAGFNLLQCGSFKPDALEVVKAAPGAHSMQYICSRTIYHELLFPKYPELKEAAILNPDGSYKIIYNNPKRYAGCWNRPAWLAYLKARMDEIKARGVDTIFFDNPMTWACHCPTCQELFTRFAQAQAGETLKLGQFGKPTELENWFTLDTAVRFWTQVRDYAHSQSMFIVANNMTYWLINQGLTDGVFSEGNGHAPFGRDLAAYKIGLATGHGKPTGILDYVPRKVMEQRGKTAFNSSQGSGDKWVGAPIAEEFQVALAQGVACGGNTIANFQLELGRRIEQLTVPEDRKIIDGLKLYNGFIQAHPEVYAQARPASPVAVLYSLTAGPREGQILGHSRGAFNSILWALQRQGVPAEVIVEDDLTSARLAGLKAIVLSDVPILEPEAARGLAAFAKSGGTVVVAGGTSVRGRHEGPERARPLSSLFPGSRPIYMQVYAPADFTTEGYEPQPPWLKVTTDVGRATIDFKGEAGKYRLVLSYFDESDGQGSFDLEVDGTPVGTWQNTADDDATHTHGATGVALKPGARITVVGHSGGGEYGRFERLTIMTDGGANIVETKIGKGKLLQALAPLTQLAAEDVARLATPLCGQLPARLRTGAMPNALLNLTRGSDGALCAHIVNYDFRYDDKFALQSIEPTPAVTLQAPGVKRAMLLSPGAEARALVVKGGMIEVPPIRIYGVIVMR